MVRRFHRSIYDELDELRASMDYLYQLALEPAESHLIPSPEQPGLVCRYVHNRSAEVTGQDDEVMVTLDLDMGSGTSKISVDLINDTLLKITCEQHEGEDNDGNTLQAMRSFSLHHIVLLPDPVTRCGARLRLRHGVLDIHLRKTHSVPE
jgi:HSP20 family protein